MVEATAYGLSHSQSSTKVAVKMLKCKSYVAKTQQGAVWGGPMRVSNTVTPEPAEL